MPRAPRTDPVMQTDELDIADQDSYGYRDAGPDVPPTRVRVFEGTPVPPDIESTEPTTDFEEQRSQYPETVAANMSEEDQERVQKERNESTQGGAQYNPELANQEDPGPRSRVPAGAIDMDERPDTANDPTGRSGGRRSRKKDADEGV
jgi:hypothetical protein